MILLSLLNQLAINQRLYEHNDISLVELRHQTLVAIKALRGELDLSNAAPSTIEYIDSLLDADGLTVICCYPEDLQRILSFAERTISAIIEKNTTVVEKESSLEEIISEDLDGVFIISEKEVNELFEKISNISPNNDKLAWRRLYKELQRHLIEYETINNEFLEVKTKRMTLNKTINEMREKMVNECVHPKTELVYKGDHVVCKFCEKRLKLT